MYCHRWQTCRPGRICKPNFCSTQTTTLIYPLSGDGFTSPLTGLLSSRRPGTVESGGRITRIPRHIPGSSQPSGSTTAEPFQHRSLAVLVGSNAGGRVMPADCPRSAYRCSMRGISRGGDKFSDQFSKDSKTSTSNTFLKLRPTSVFRARWLK